MERMTQRTKRTSVIFSKPFSLDGVDGAQPAGTYGIETIEEALDTPSSLAYRRVSTTIELPAMGEMNFMRQLITIDPRELEAALARDKATGDHNLDAQEGASMPRDGNHNAVHNRRTQIGGNWGILPVLIAAAVLIVGLWLYIDREDPHPVTGRDSPPTSAPRK
jgi:hypothetical protein